MISLFTRLLIFIVILYETQSNLDLCSFQELKNEPRSMKPLRTFIPSWGASGSSETSDVTSGSCGLRFVVCCVVDNELFFFIYLKDKINVNINERFSSVGDHNSLHSHLYGRSLRTSERMWEWSPKYFWRFLHFFSRTQLDVQMFYLRVEGH